LSITPVDTTGAGDAFVGVLAAGLDQGHELTAALARASVAAGLACTKVGAQTSQPTAAEIEARLGELPAPVPIG
jgi:ribokinase